MGKFIIIKCADGGFQFNVKSGNGEIILTSEGYASKANCQYGIESVKEMHPTMLTTIGTSRPMENFTSIYKRSMARLSERANCIIAPHPWSSVKSNAATAGVEDKF